MTCSDSLCAVLLGNAGTAERAAAFARTSQHCPYVAHYTSADRLVVGVFVLPRSKRWWIEMPQAQPELLGLERVEVHVTDRVAASSPWSRGKVAPVLGLAPCKTDCGTCPQYGERCAGCPATTYYERET
jgi:hypothetical protein